ncbi:MULTISPECIES: helix-turn-helix domain-containing protein [Bacillati]|uniref:helix-turn-helix domain-containing protein n=1 Tax=Bacillati TaxID=1783272 RepID=UPI000471E09B|nr:MULTISPECIES: helix-turn-helix transcriptional regulator [Bacillus amyloliquefaciens group]ASB66868.1 hypothetical protein S101413_03451 [Bacillus velezensis]MCV2522860.1 helix-turn-helix domain-containing protein [Bacillus velezensis]MEB3986785.1 helix-turn-helix domain-containing protein [Bacillus velezensis]MEC3920897.1 helix-turn-helix transcriptional regulator [Bacillus velezensis]PJN83878.1 XRE family transcriptional regulator [Bacillus velezensis]
MKYKPGRCLLRDRLHERGLTQTQLADRSGYDKSHVSKYALGKQEMTLSTAKTFAAIIGCSIDDLYEWVPQD